MDNIHQAKLKNGHLLNKMALVQSQRSRTALQIFTAKLQPHYSQRTVSQIELQPLTVHSDWL